MKLNVRVAGQESALAEYQQPIGDSVAPSGQKEGGHYYTVVVDPRTGVETWSPLYTATKDYSLREARADHENGKYAIPSVTTYFKVLAKPQLERWKMEAAAGAMYDELFRRYTTGNLGASLVTDRGADIAKAMAVAGSASKGAQDLGTRIHDGIEKALRFEPYDADLQPYVDAVMQQRQIMGIKGSHPEECMGSLKYGYAGRCDDYTDDMQVIDYKSRKSKGKKVPSYETDTIQLAAYGFAKFGNQFFKTGKAHIFAISTTQPGLLTVHTFTGPELVESFQTFLALTATWRFINKYDPRVAQQAAPAVATRQQLNHQLQDLQRMAYLLGNRSGKSAAPSGLSQAFRDAMDEQVKSLPSMSPIGGLQSLMGQQAVANLGVAGGGGGGYATTMSADAIAKMIESDGNAV